jgi:glycosyltransferase involved in cell wall biosynthesis
VYRISIGRGWTTNTAFNSISYYYFEYLVWKKFGPAIRRGDYDIVHRITPLSPTTPSILARRCRLAGVPFVLGPLNGGLPWPASFTSARLEEKEWLSYVRNAHKILPGYSSTRKNSAAIIVGSQNTFKQMNQIYHRKCVYIPENAIEPERFTFRRSKKAHPPLKIIFVGRLVPYKGADMLIEAAIPFIRQGNVQVTIVGDGPDYPKIKFMIETYGIQDGVKMTGWVDHTHIQKHLANADLFGFPSIREFGGAVVLEAMAVGLVPLVVRYGGPEELVTNKTGFLLELGTRSSIILQIRRLLEKLVESPGEIDKRSEPARSRAFNQFTWDVKARQVVEVYKWVLGKRLEKPDFGMPFSEKAPTSTNFEY